VLNQTVYATAARPATQTCTQLRKVGLVARRHNFHVAVFGIAHPSAQFQLARFAMHEPSETNSLHTPLNQEMKNHGSAEHPRPVLQMNTLSATGFKVR
jgi:hypothetical protein